MGTVAAIVASTTRAGAVCAAWAELHGTDPATLACFEDAYVGVQSDEDLTRRVLDDLQVEKQLHQTFPELLRGYVTVDYATPGLVTPEQPRFTRSQPSAGRSGS